MGEFFCRRIYWSARVLSCLRMSFLPCLLRHLSFKLFFMITRDVSSLQHPIVKHLVKLRSDRGYRSMTHTALISGIKLISELSALHVFKTVLIAQGYFPPTTLNAEKTLVVTEEIMKKVTALQAPEPLAAEILMPDLFEFSRCRSLLILDQITDPGNLGNLLRTALALGWDAVFLTPGSADPFNDKALRAAKGATFKIKLCQGTYEELFDLVNNNGLKLLIADVNGKAVDALFFQQPVALVLGNESRGAHSILKNSGTTIAISMSKEMESLNVSSAGAILMFHLQGGFHGK